MKKVRNILIAACMAVAGLFTSSCLNLDETPYDFLTDATLDFSNEQTISEISGNVYSFLRKTYWTYYGMWDWTEDSSDLHMFPSRIGVGWGDYYISYHKHQFSPELENINYVIWYHSYVGIMYANQCLGNQTFLEKMPEKVAEIRAIRAFYYYILFDSYRSIMILPEGETEEGYLPTQVEPQVAFDYIVNELKLAAKDLPETGTFDMPTKYMAYMTLAKMHLNYYAWMWEESGNTYAENAQTVYSGDESGQTKVSHYEEALYWVDKVLSSNKFQLASNYLDNHKQDISGSPEIIWGINLDPTEATGCYLGPACLPQQGAAAFGVSSGWNGGCAIPQFIDTYASDREEIEAGTKKIKLDKKGYPVVTYYDSRFYDTWAYGQQYEYKTNNRVPIYDECDAQGTTRVYYTKEVHSIDNPGAYMFEGYRYKKSEIVAEGDASTFGNDVPVYRLADANFIAAECILRLGGSSKLAGYDKGKAVQLVNEVRARAFRNAPAGYAWERTLADLEGGSVYDYGVRDFTYSEGYQIQAINYTAGKEVPLYQLPVDENEDGEQDVDDKGNLIWEDTTTPNKNPKMVACQNFTYLDFAGNKMPVAKGHEKMIWGLDLAAGTPAESVGGGDIELGGLLDDLAWEFVGEYHRRQDLIRFRINGGMNVWNGKSWFCKRAESNKSDYHKNRYPISQDNMDSNIALVQNPGYPQRGDVTE